MKLEQVRDLKKIQSNEINDFFDSTYSKVYSDLLGIELHDQINFISNNYLESLSNNIAILDLGCGTGRHIKSLGNKDYIVDGVDINPEAVKIAKKDNPTATIFLSDAQFFKPNIKYDLIYSMESSIGYLTDDDTVNIFKNISKNVLADKGLFIIHLINRDYLAKNLSQRVWFGNPTNGYLLENRTFESEFGLLKIEQVRIIDGKDKKYSINLRLYSLNELKYLLKEAGLQINKVFGNYNNEQFSINSPYMIIECSKINSSERGVSL
ncbi:methyltransferase domain-containing protein [Streptococcus hyovaginalis]|uniref:class I SAM-dependent methyltransferase n=1 Tax=Streptococcus hyovaginalis TaxID=149015 RepID=UPI002A7E2FE8|nr:class I SAM-dependent methyltransferase [Streptococcus hyovaginalis]MDY3023993.1 class I SAM-dependent methyltransferase [Streptococcus hyovaginalis]MDY4510912.1 class I SAM-dependent methyltransferase [Streptococcus hyovaginalis]MDY5974887.1 class I SAM-dependent methyltransferase [Streptococcus hyovaginalis]